MPDEFEIQIPVVRKSTINHLNRQIPPFAHTRMYNWHKFWSRKTWNVVAEFIKTYCSPTGVVFDPFAGSGVTALEALKHGRRAIVCDILPVSTEIIRLTIKPVSLTKLAQAYERVEARVKKKILSLYTTRCRKCQHEFPLTCAIWLQNREAPDKPISRECVDIRYAGCPMCKDRREKDTTPEDFDLKLIRDIEKAEIIAWYPKNKLYHINGKPFMKKEKYESIDELFTKRNLQALALLMEAIEEEPNKDLRDFLKIAFTSIVHLATCMMPVRPTRPFSGGWTEHSYWFATEFMEQNVWGLFESAIVGRQGLLKAKEESNTYYKNIRFASSYEDVITGKADVYVYTGSCFDLMKQMHQTYGEGCVDYIFTDPPYDASVQYGELAYLWVAWLKKDTGYLERIASDEVIRNERQEKNFTVYHSLLRRSFQDMYHILKPDACLTVTFHNPTFKIRNATIYAGVFAGFEFQKIHHQELARPSAKSLLQPFGSAQGDFYLRFYKPPAGEGVIKPTAIDDVRFEKIVVETAIRIIAERGEPTPYTIIINAIDPELARHGFFSELNTGLDVKTVLQNHVDQEFTLITAKKGSAQGQLWWFRDPSKISRLEHVPLTERVEQTVLRKLQQRARVTFTEMWDAVSSEFPNSLTSDSMSIIDALHAYAKPVKGGYWLLKSNFTTGEIEKEHTTMIAILAEIGKKQGYQLWIGNNEQSHRINNPLLSGTGELRQYRTYTHIGSIKNIQNAETVEDIDLLWIKGNLIHNVFEVESTTSMTSGLQRGSNVDPSVPKFLIIPEEREEQLMQKLKSPMFAERFQSDNWHVLYFEALKEAFHKHKGQTDIHALIDKKIMRKVNTGGQHEDQLSLLHEG